jgi:hypothetical protein
MNEIKTVQSAEPQTPDNAVDKKELDSKTYPDLPNLETETQMPDVELSNLWMIVLGAAFLALWATNVCYNLLKPLY